MYNSNKLKNKWGFTLVELVISTAISGIILLILLTFITNSIRELGISNAQSDLTISLGKFTSDFGNFSSIYSKKQLLIDNAEGEGTDIVMLTDTGGLVGVVYGLVDPTRDKVFTGSSDYSLYNEKRLGYKRLNQAQITALESNPSSIYDHTFFKDKYYKNVYFRDLQIEMFNSSALIDMNLDMLLKYDSGLSQDGLSYSDLGRGNFYSVNINF